MRSKFCYLVLFFCFAAMPFAVAQICPVNIGFENNTFSGWSCYIGDVYTVGKEEEVKVVVTSAVPGRHTIIKNTSPQVKDPYGGFPVNCPNGSGYSIMLGNSAKNHQAERISYKYRVPDGQNNYTLIYYYAAVLQDGGHDPELQPRFVAALTDLTTGQPLGCGNHTFVPKKVEDGDFLISPLDATVHYKAWSPVVINLINCGGHEVLLEFTTNDCTKTGHFGYAYLDFNETCENNNSGTITGNVFCQGSQNSITLKAPPGFKEYRWYDKTHSQVLSGTSNYTISPAPPVGVTYTLEVEPFPDLGCPATFTTTIQQSTEGYNLQVQPSVTRCADVGADLTAPEITAGSSPMKTFEYFEDPLGQVYLSDPKLVLNSGTYYIRAINNSGCSEMKPIRVNLIATPGLNISNPAPVCFPGKVDIFADAVVGAKVSGIRYQYFTDVACTKELTQAQARAIDKTGTFYVKATNDLGCFAVQPVNVIVSAIPVVRSYKLAKCPPVDISTSEFLTENTPGLAYTYWADAEATVAINDPKNITESSTYYIKGTNIYGCSSIAQITVNVYPVPDFTVVNPIPVTYPSLVDLRSSFIPADGITYTYWKDSVATIPVTNFNNVSIGGKYFIRGENIYHCTRIKPITVVISPPAEADLTVTNTFTPNGDGINDTFSPVSKGIVRVNYLKVYNREGQIVFSTKILFNQWDGTFNNKAVPAGTYYWVYNCFDVYHEKEITRSGSVTVVR